MSHRWLSPSSFPALLIMLVLGCCSLPGRADNPSPHHTGMRPPTAAELAWMKTHMISTTQVALNDIGLRRINESRRTAGLPLLDQRQAVPRGREVTDAHLLGSGHLLGGGLLPPSVDNSQSQYFPPVGDQGAQGSCASFSSTYYTMTYMVAQSLNVNAQTGGDATHYSPKWTYNMINGGG